MLWAGQGQLDNLIDSGEQTVMDIGDDVLHHMIDEHHDGHDCHMSAHLIGINSPIASLISINSTQIFPTYNVRFATFQPAPPNKPPRV